LEISHETNETETPRSNQLITEGPTFPLRGREALAILHDDVFMQPWFIPKPIYLAIRRLLPNVHLMENAALL
jgi:hypothetical protein